MHWMDILLAIMLILVGGGEAYAIKNKVPGDTISERTRVYFQVKKESTTKVGAYAFIMLIGTFFAWFVPHILKYVAV